MRPGRRFSTLVSIVLSAGCFLVQPGMARAGVTPNVQPPTDGIDALTFMRYLGQLREYVIKGDTIWYRMSSDGSVDNMPPTWSSQPLGEIWTSATWPDGGPAVPTSGIDTFGYQQFFGCGNLQNRMIEQITKGGDIWYRYADDINGTNLLGKKFIHTTMAANWGGTGIPTDGLDSINYDVYNGQPRQLLVKGDNIWFRSYNCTTNVWSGWTSFTFSAAYGSTKISPPLPGNYDAFVTDYETTGTPRQIIIQGNQVWTRESMTHSGQVISDTWDTNLLKYFWLEGAPQVTAAQIPGGLTLTFNANGSQQTASLNGTWYIRPEGTTTTLYPMAVPGWWRRDAYGSKWYVMAQFTNAFCSTNAVGQRACLDNAYPGWRGAVVYATKFTIPSNMAGKALNIDFDGVSAYSEVYLNNTYVGKHLGQIGSFSLPVQQAAIVGGTNVLTLRVADRTDFQGTILGTDMFDKDNGGIYEGVRVVATNVVHAEEVKVDTPNLHTAAVKARVVNTGGAGASAYVKAEVVNGAGAVIGSANSSGFTVGAGSTYEASWQVNVSPNPSVWTPETPNLYSLRVSVYVNNTVVDQLYQSFGFRTFGTNGSKFLLNGQAYFLQGVSTFAHNQVINDPTFIAQFMARVKEVGANAIRFHAFPPSQYWLDEADKQGILVYNESVSWWDNSTKVTIPWYRDRVDQEYTNVIARDYNHPSVVLWAFGNENILFNPGYEGYRTFFNQLITRAKSEFGSRYLYFADAGCMSYKQYGTSVYSGDFGAICGNGDVTDTHWYYGWMPMPISDPLVNTGNVQFTGAADQTKFNHALDILFSYNVSKPEIFSEYGGGYTDEQGNFWPNTDFVNRPTSDTSGSVSAIGTNPVRPTDALEYQRLLTLNTTTTLLARKNSSRLSGVFFHGFDWLLYNPDNLDPAKLKIWYLAAYAPPCKTDLPCITTDGAGGSQRWVDHAALEPKPGYYALQAAYGATPTNTPVPPTLTPIPPTATPTPTPGDVNGDGHVDLTDLSMVIAKMGTSTCPQNDPADVNGDCQVDIFDFNIIVTNFKP